MALRRGIALVLTGVTSWSLSAASLPNEDPSPPELSNFSVVPASLPHQGGSVVMRVDAVDPDGIDFVGATVYLADGGAIGVEMTVDDPEQPDVYSGSASIPANFNEETVSHSIEVLASDSVGDQTLEILGGVDVEGQPPFDERPDVFDPEVTPTTLPSGGGDVSISAAATDDRAVSEVYAYITGENVSEVVPLGGEVSGRYSATWTAPPNAGESDLTYSIEITALDDIGQDDTEYAGDVTVAGTPPFDEVPDVFDPTLDPVALPHTGGPVDISASATDDRAVSEVYATITSATGTEVVPLDGISASRYAATWDAPPNTSPGDATYTVEISALDDIGQQDTEPAGDVTVAGTPPVDEAPDVFDPDVAPSILPAGGGDVTLSVSATDDNAVSLVQARVTDSTGTVDYVNLVGESATRYSGTWSAPANDTADDHVYEVHITAYDDNDQTDFVIVGFTVAGAPPAVSKLSLSKKQLTFGPVRVGRTLRRSVLLRNEGLSPVVCTVTSPGGRFRLPGDRDLSLTLAPGRTKRIVVLYRSLTAGRHRSRLRIVRADGRQSRLGAGLVGTATRR